MLDFLKELVQEVPDPSAGGTIDLDGPDSNKRSRKGKKAATAGDEEEEMELDGGEAPKPKRKRRKKKDDADDDDDGVPAASGSRKAAGGRGGGGRGRGRKASASKAAATEKVDRTKSIGEAWATDREHAEGQGAAYRDDEYDSENGEVNGGGHGRDGRIEENFDEEEED